MFVASSRKRYATDYLNTRHFFSLRRLRTLYLVALVHSSRRGATLPWALEHAKPGRLRKLPLSVTEVVYTTKVVYLPVLINPGSQFDSFKSRIPVKYKQCLRTATRGDRRRSYLHVLPYLVDEKFDGATSINFPERGSMVPLSTLVSLKKKGLRVSKGPCR